MRTNMNGTQTHHMVIRHVYLEHLPDHGRDLKKDCFYHGLCPYLHDALSFAMAELPKREQARPTFDTLYTLVKKLEAGQLALACHYTPQFRCLSREAQTLPCANRKGGSPGGGGSGTSQSHLSGGLQVRSGGCGWYQRAFSSGDEPLSEGGAEMLCVWVTWQFC